MISYNDRHDPMMGLVPISGAELTDSSGIKRVITVPQGEFSSRLGTAGATADRFSITIGDPDDAEEGTAPDIWSGVVESWQPSGSKIRVVCRPARTVQEIAGTLLSTQGGFGSITPRMGGAG